MGHFFTHKLVTDLPQRKNSAYGGGRANPTGLGGVLSLELAAPTAKSHSTYPALWEILCVYCMSTCVCLPVQPPVGPCIEMCRWCQA